MTVLDGTDPIGTVTSGCLSPTLDCPIAMAYVPAGEWAPGTRLRVDLGGGTDAEVVDMPFYTRS